MIIVIFKVNYGYNLFKCYLIIYLFKKILINEIIKNLIKINKH